MVLSDIPMSFVLPKLEGPMSANFIFYHIYSVNSLALEAPKDKGGLFKDYFTFTSNLLFLNIFSRICFYFLLFVVGWSLSARLAGLLICWTFFTTALLCQDKKQQTKQRLRICQSKLFKFTKLG